MSFWTKGSRISKRSKAIYKEMHELMFSKPMFIGPSRETIGQKDYDKMGLGSSLSTTPKSY